MYQIPLKELLRPYIDFLITCPWDHLRRYNISKSMKNNDVFIESTYYYQLPSIVTQSIGNI